MLLECREQNAAHNGADENGEDPLQAAVNHGKHQEATMRSGNVDAQQQGEHRGDGRGDHHDGHDGPDVLGHERDGALGDVGAAKDDVDDAGVMIFLGEVFLAGDDREAGNQRRNDAGGGDGGHERGAVSVLGRADASLKAGTQQHGAGYIGSLVDRTTHVDRAHAANSDAQGNSAGVLQAAKEVHHAVVDGDHGAGDAQHHKTNDERGEQRVQEDRLETVQVSGQFSEYLLQQQDDVTGKKTANDSAQETKAHAGTAGIDKTGLSRNGQTLDCDHTGDETRNQSGALSDGLGDISGQHGNHKVHSDAADGLKHGGERVVIRSGGIKRRDAPQEGDGGKDAAGDDEHQHMGNAVHKVLVELMAEALLLRAGSLLRNGGDGIGVRLGGQGVVDQLAGCLLRNGARNTHGNHGLAGEALGVDVFVGGDNHGASRGDLGGGQRVLDTDLAMGLDLDGEPSFGRGLFKRLLRHEGVGDTRWAARGSNNVVLLCHVPSLNFHAPAVHLITLLYMSTFDWFLSRSVSSVKSIFTPASGYVRLLHYSFAIALHFGAML